GEASVDALAASWTCGTALVAPLITSPVPMPQSEDEDGNEGGQPIEIDCRDTSYSCRKYRLRRPERPAGRPGADLFRDRELAEGDTEVPATARAREGQRHFALGHHVRLGRFHGPRVGLGRDIRAQQLVDGLHARELALALIDRRLADGEAAAARPELHLQGLAVVAMHGARTVRRLVEGRPAAHGEVHGAFDGPSGPRGGCAH